MRQSTFVLMLLAYVALFSGCAGFAEYHKHQRQRRQAKKQLSVVDSNWKQGYGYNNPNHERIEQGIETVNFNGKTDSENKSNFVNDLIGNLVGDMIGFGIKSTFTTVVDAFKR